MRLKTLLFSLLILSLSSLFVVHCAGTKKEEDMDSFDTERNQKENLDDIEALLGISSDKTEDPQAAAKKDEKLELLESGEVTAKQTHSSSYAAAAQKDDEAQKLREKDKEVQRLKNQMKQKDRKIAELNALVDEQDSQIQKLQKTGAPSSYASAAGAVSMDEYKTRYDEALSAFKARQYQQAIEYFESLLAASSSHSLADNAQFWIGECHFALRQYDAAIIDFEKVLTFPKSNKKADAQFKLVYCYLRKGNKEKAREEFERLKADFSDSHFVAKAQKMLAR